MKQYIAFIELEKEPDVDVLGVVFPDFPGCVSVGKTYEEAFRNAHEALSLHIAGMREDGEYIPEPRTLEAIERDWKDFSDWKGSRYAVSYISALPVSQNKVYSISMDSNVMARIDARSKNRSAFLESAARKVLDEEPLRQQA